MNEGNKIKSEFLTERKNYNLQYMSHFERNLLNWKQKKTIPIFTEEHFVYSIVCNIRLQKIKNSKFQISIEIRGDG